MPHIPFTDPLQWFDRWLEEAKEASIVEPTAMTLATLSAHGQPQARIVLLKHHDRKGFVFYTNTESPKGEALSHHPRAGLNFYWADLYRQVRVEGPVELVSVEEADAYFASRPRESQIGAWASQQSRPLESRAGLLEAVAEIERRFETMDVPRPPHWTGYRVIPERMEFWMAGDFRLHDRWEFVRDEPASPWTSQRLYP